MTISLTNFSFTFPEAAWSRFGPLQTEKKFPLHVRKKRVSCEVYRVTTSCFTKCINKQLVHKFTSKAVPHSSTLGVFVAFTHIIDGTFIKHFNEKKPPPSLDMYSIPSMLDIRRSYMEWRFIFTLQFLTKPCQNLQQSILT